MSYPLNKVCALVLLSFAVPGAAYAEPCRTQSFGAASYIVCSFNLTREDLRTYWRRDDGKPYRTFAALAEDLEGKGKLLRFAMNGGMYRNDFRPVGLYIENGRELTSANTATLTGAPSQIRTSTKNRMAFSTLATMKRAFSRRDVSSPKGQTRSSPPSQGRCSSLTGRSTQPSLSVQPIASRGTASAYRARPRYTLSLPSDGRTFTSLRVFFATVSAVTMLFFSMEARPLGSMRRSLAVTTRLPIVVMGRS